MRGRDDCETCGKPLRTSKARFCLECNRERARLTKQSLDDLDPSYRHALEHDPCAYCGRVGADFWRPHIGIDHIIATSNGGEYGWENMAGCCRDCNSSKQDRPLLRYMLRLIEW